MIRDTILTFLAVTFAFSLGWCMCGYRIYSGMYQAAYNTPEIAMVAKNIGRR